MRAVLHVFGIVALVVAASIVGCQLGENADGSDQVAIACASVSASIKVLTTANEAGKLSSAQQQGILRSIGLIDPICASKAQPSLDDVQRAAFFQAAAYLQQEASR